MTNTFSMVGNLRSRTKQKLKIKVVQRTGTDVQNSLRGRPSWLHFLPVQIRDDEAEEAAGAVATPFFPNIMLKQLRFKTLVVKFPREAYKILYFYLKPPPPPFVIPLRRPCKWLGVSIPDMEIEFIDWNSVVDFQFTIGILGTRKL